jgi:hypothetical protein
VILVIIWWWKKLGRLAVNKQTVPKFHMERLHLKKLNEFEGKNSIGLKSQDRLEALENLDSDVYNNTAWEIIREYKNLSQRE